MGNPERALTDGELETIKPIIKKLKKNKIIILYDADAASAPQLTSLIGDFSIAISGSNTDLPNGITIQNPYYRLRLFQDVSSLVMTPDSIVGFAAMLTRQKTSYIIGAKEDYSDAFRKWAFTVSSLNYELRSSNFVTVEKADDFSPPSANRVDWDPRILEGIRTGNPATIGQWIPPDTLRRIVNENELVTKAKKNLDKLPEGLAFFGAGGGGYQYEGLIKDSIKAVANLNVPVATGGSGGLMAVANRVAYEVGTESIGIPMGSKFRLSSELKDADEFHSHTVAATDYASRIPFLLKNRPLVAVGPGGKGTMRELATTLFLLNSEGPNSKRHLMFLGSDFYSGLFKLFEKSNMPEFLRSRIHLIEDAKQVPDVVSEVEHALGPENRDLLRMPGPLTPRKVVAALKETHTKKGSPLAGDAKFVRGDKVTVDVPWHSRHGQEGLIISRFANYYSVQFPDGKIVEIYGSSLVPIRSAASKAAVIEKPAETAPGRDIKVGDTFIYHDHGVPVSLRKGTEVESTSIEKAEYK